MTRSYANDDENEMRYRNLYVPFYTGKEASFSGKKKSNVFELTLSALAGRASSGRSSRRVAVLAKTTAV